MRGFFLVLRGDEGETGGHGRVEQIEKDEESGDRQDGERTVRERGSGKMIECGMVKAQMIESSYFLADNIERYDVEELSPHDQICYFVST